MNAWTALLMNVVIGSVIGGVTNEIAIRMLFRPFKPWMIGSFRVPFTPGLIPRRHDELAEQMGRMVEEHLITREGLREALTRKELEESLSRWLTAYAENLLHGKKSVRDLILQYAPCGLTDEGRWNDVLRESVYRQYQNMLCEWMGQVADKPLAALIPPEGTEKLDHLIDQASQTFVTRFREFLHSPEGHQQVQAMLKNVLGGGGGMFGGMIGMFLGDDKIIGKIIPYLDEMIGNPALIDRISSLIRQEADKLLENKVGQLVEWIGEENVKRVSDALFQKIEEGSLRWIDKPLESIFEPFKEVIVSVWIPRLSGWFMAKLADNVDRLMDKLSIRKLVAKQVAQFPLERVEEMIIGISGKEFRMITVLGFLLGALIGILQGMINLFFH